MPKVPRHSGKENLDNADKYVKIMADATTKILKLSCHYAFREALLSAVDAKDSHEFRQKIEAPMLDAVRNIGAKKKKVKSASQPSALFTSQQQNIPAEIRSQSQQSSLQPTKGVKDAKDLFSMSLPPEVISKLFSSSSEDEEVEIKQMPKISADSQPRKSFLTPEDIRKMFSSSSEGEEESQSNDNILPPLIKKRKDEEKFWLSLPSNSSAAIELTAQSSAIDFPHSAADFVGDDD